MNLVNLLSIFLLIFTQFHTSKRHVSSNQYMFLSTIEDATRLFPSRIYTKASNLSRPVTASASTPQERSGYMDTVQDYPKFVKPTCKHTRYNEKQHITCEKACVTFYGSHLVSWRLSHIIKFESLSTLFIIFTMYKRKPTFQYPFFFVSTYLPYFWYNINMVTYTFACIFFF